MIPGAYERETVNGYDILMPVIRGPKPIRMDLDDFPMQEKPYSDPLKQMVITFVNGYGVHYLRSMYDMVMAELERQERYRDSKISLERRVRKIS